MTTDRTPAAPPWLIDADPPSGILAHVEEGLSPGTVLECSPTTRVSFAWDGHGEPARGVLLRYVDGTAARVIVKDAILSARHLRTGSLGRRGCPREVRDDLWMHGIRVRA